MVAEVAKQMRHLFIKANEEKKKHKLQRRSLSLVAALRHRSDTVENKIPSLLYKSPRLSLWTNHTLTEINQIWVKRSYKTAIQLLLNHHTTMHFNISWSAVFD